MVDPAHNNLAKYLKVVEADSSTSWADIEAKYRQLIQKWHPDRNLGANNELAQSKFIEINSAYKELKAHYKNRAAPKPIPAVSKNRVHGAKHTSADKPSPSKATLVFSFACGALLFVCAAVLWSIDSKMEKSNRDRATLELVTKQQKTESTQGFTNFKRQTASHVEE